MEELSSTEGNDHSQLQKIGEKLKEANVGGMITFENQHEQGEVFLFYSKIPMSADLVTVQKNIMLPFSTTMLRTLCEMQNLALGAVTKWNCKIKGTGRLETRCSNGGYGGKSRSDGTRNRDSRKVNCPAKILTSPFSLTLKRKSLLELVKKEINLVQEEAQSQDQSDYDFCIITTAVFNHENHPLDPSGPEEIVLSRREDVLQNDEVCKELKMFLKISPRGKGCILLACEYLRMRFPNVCIPELVVKNVISKIRNEEEDAFELVPLLRQQKRDNIVEFLDMQLDDISGVLRSITWCNSRQRQ